MPSFSKLGFYDGPLALPAEIEGSGSIQVDPITTTQILTRKYAQLKTVYQPPVIGSSSFNDTIFSQAFFVSEHVDDIRGGLVFFHRIFCTVPPPRTESRLISFTYPGRSQAYFSNGKAIGWNAYGAAAPKTRLVSATVLFTYALQLNIVTDPSTIFAGISQPSSITFNGKLVDYTGDVYTPSGTVYLPGNRAQAGWLIAGTIPTASATPWIISIEQKRFMGPVWEQAIVQLTSGLAF